MAKYPILLNLTDRKVVVIGGGKVAFRKVQTLLATKARLFVVAENISETIRDICAGTNTELIRSKYSKDYLAAALLAIAATNNLKLNQRIYKDCQQLEVLCNVVDQPELCDFYVPAVVSQGDLQIAVSTEGNCPAYAGHVRAKLEKMFTEVHGDFVKELEAKRRNIVNTIPDAETRKAILGKLVDDESFDYFSKNGSGAWNKMADSVISENK